ncbi:GNAT family N-acetyltransferase [Thiolapillus sp.]
MSFKIILADQDEPDHVQAIQRLWDDNLHFVAEGRYAWLYQDNPAGNTLTCLAVHEETGEIIGTASAMCRNFYFKGEAFKAGIAVDFAIDAEYRVFGPALLLQRTLVEYAWEKGLDFMLGFPNKASQGIVRRVGYEQMGKSIRFSRLIRTRSKLTAMLRQRNLPKLLAGPAATILDAGLYLQNRISSPHGAVRIIGSESDLDDYWRDFWDSNSAIDAFQGDHGEDYICWRYLQCPYKDYRLFSLFEGQRLVAFLVFSSRDDGLVLVDDFRFLEEKWVGPLFNHFWRKMRSSGNTVINVGLIIGAGMEQLMKDAGFMARPSERWGGILSNPEKSVDWRKVLAADSWYITDGEIDL